MRQEAHLGRVRVRVRVRVKDRVRVRVRVRVTARANPNHPGQVGEKTHLGRVRVTARANPNHPGKAREETHLAAAAIAHLHPLNLVHAVLLTARARAKGSVRVRARVS